MSMMKLSSILPESKMITRWSRYSDAGLYKAPFEADISFTILETAAGKDCVEYLGEQI